MKFNSWEITPSSSSITDNMINEPEKTLNSTPDTFSKFKQHFQKATQITDISKYIFFQINKTGTFCFYDDITYGINVLSGSTNSIFKYTYKLKASLIPNIQLRSNKVDNLQFEEIDEIKKKQEVLIEEYTKDIIQHQEQSNNFLKKQRALFLESRNAFVTKNSHLANYFERTLFRQSKKQLGIHLDIPKETPQEGKEAHICNFCLQKNQSRLFQCSICDNYYVCDKCINLIKEYHDHEFFILRNKIVEKENKIEIIKDYDLEIVNKDKLLKIKYQLNSTNYPKIEIELKNKGTKAWTSKKVEINYLPGDLKKKGTITLSILKPIEMNQSTCFKIDLKDFSTELNEKGVKNMNLKCYGDKKNFGEDIQIKVTIE